MNQQAGGHARLAQRLADIPSDPQMLVNATTPLKLFMCASDTGFTGRGQVSPARGFGSDPGGGPGAGTSASNNIPLAVGMSNYMGVIGHRFVSGTVRNTGIFYGNSYTRDADIIDGLSNTAMFGERDTQICQSGSWLGVENGGGTGTIPTSNPPGWAQVGGFSFPKLNQTDFPQFGLGILSKTGCGTGFSSNHPGGANFSFADGGVRYIVNGINWQYQPGPPSSQLGPPPNPPSDALNHKNTGNGVYQAMMSINDKIPPGSLGP
jgi:prepilin-type processing-associated H-X9-DG protein